MRIFCIDSSKFQIGCIFSQNYPLSSGNHYTNFEKSIRESIGNISFIWASTVSRFGNFQAKESKGIEWTTFVQRPAV